MVSLTNSPGCASGIRKPRRRNNREIGSRNHRCEIWYAKAKFIAIATSVSAKPPLMPYTTPAITHIGLSGIPMSGKKESAAKNHQNGQPCNTPSISSIIKLACRFLVWEGFNHQPKFVAIVYKLLFSFESGYYVKHLPCRTGCYFLADGWGCFGFLN